MKREFDSAWLSLVAKMNKLQLEVILKTRGYELIDFIDKNDMQAYVAECEEGQVIVFRQSEADLGDWINNLKFTTKYTAFGNIHHGYFNLIKDAWDELTEKITDDGIIAVAFSQGASLSAIFMKMYRYINRIPNTGIGYIAFEPLKVSTDDNFNPAGIYTIQGNDVVPRLPFRIMGFKELGGDLVYFNRNGDCKINCKRWLRFKDFFLDTVGDGIKHLKGKHRLDHDIELIKKRWEKNFDKKIKPSIK